jgi:hypothetical protein
MEEIIASIKGFVLRFKPDLAGEDDLLDMNVEVVVNRALIYMNRMQLVDAFEEDNTEESPIPSELHIVLAQTVVSAYKTQQMLNSADTGAIKSIDDNGQSITYSDKVANFFSSGSDSEVFGGTAGLLNQYRLPTILGRTCSI